MAPTGNGKTILLAEDNQQVPGFVRTMLQENGYSVMIAVNGQDALKQSRGFEGVIHLPLSDVEMPNMTGIELATQLHGQTAETKPRPYRELSSKCNPKSHEGNGA